VKQDKEIYSDNYSVLAVNNKITTVNVGRKMAIQTVMYMA